MSADISLKQRLIIGFGSVLILMALMVAMVARGYWETKKSTDFIDQRLLPSSQSTFVISTAISDECNNLGTYLKYGSPDAYQEYLNGLKSEEVELRRLNELSTPQQLRRYAQTESLIDTLHRDEFQALHLSQEHGRRSALNIYNSRILPTSKTTCKQMEAFGLNYKAQIHKSLNRVHLLIADLSRLFPICILLAFILAHILIATTIRAISRPTRSILAAADAVSHGDYSKSRELETGFALESGEEPPVPRNELHRIALAVCRMARRMEKRDRTLSAGASLARVCASTIDLRRLLDRFIGELADYTSSQVVALYLYEEGVLVPAGTYGLDEDSARTACAEACGLSMQAVREARAIILPSIPDDTLFAIRPGLGKAVPKSMACIPILMHGDVIGITVLASLHEYDENAVSLMNTSADQAGVAISNALRYMEMKKLADELQARNEDLDARNEELLAQGEMLQVQKQEIQVQNAELAGQSRELQERNMELEYLMHDLSTIQSLTFIALSSLSQKELIARLLEIVTNALHMRFGVVKLLEESPLLHTWVTSNESDDEWANSAVVEELTNEVMRLRQIVSRNDIRRDDASFINTEIRGLIGVPIMTHERLYGVALFGCHEARNFLEREKQVLQAFAGRSAIAIERARAYDMLKQAEEKARADRERLQMIIDNAPEGIIIATAPDNLLYMANKAALSIYEVDGLPNATAEEFGRSLHFSHANGDTFSRDELPLLRTLSRGEACKREELVFRRPSGGEISILCNTVPMKDKDGQVVGAIEFFQDITSIKDKERALQAGYDHQRTIAETLQKVFLPRLADSIDDYDIADAYVPAGEDELIGGDFYDVFKIGHGVLGITMADVSGKGVKAAVHTAMAKYMIRGFASEDREPAKVLTRLNNAVARYSQDEVFVTTFFALLFTDEKRLVYANAGHEGPLVINYDTNNVTTLSGTGPAIGIMPNSAYYQREIALSDRDAVVFYTDGITEARYNKEFFGQEGLESTLVEIGDVESAVITKSLFEKVLAFSGGKLRDDAAILVIKSNALSELAI
jgi:sigma-B regulation protein RsbU (phosphoserine phosphatase)